MEEEVIAVCIDSGSGFTKAGLAGDDAPRVEFSTVTGRPKFPLTDQKEVYVGKDALLRRGTLNINTPI